MGSCFGCDCRVDGRPRSSGLSWTELSEELSSPSLRLTTRQTFQFHGILKGNVKPLIQGMHEVLLDSIAACGDVNRNVMASPNPERNAILQRVYDDARAWSEFALAEDPRLSRDLARRGACRRRRAGIRTDLRAHLPASKVQDGLCGAAVKRRRHLFAGSWVS